MDGGWSPEMCGLARAPAMRRKAGGIGVRRSGGMSRPLGAAILGVGRCSRAAVSGDRRPRGMDGGWSPEMCGLAKAPAMRRKAGRALRGSAGGIGVRRSGGMRFARVAQIIGAGRRGSAAMSGGGEPRVMDGRGSPEVSGLARFPASEWMAGRDAPEQRGRARGIPARGSGGMTGPRVPAIGRLRRGGLASSAAILEERRLRSMAGRRSRRGSGLARFAAMGE